MNGLRPDDFQAIVLPSGTVRVACATRCAYYAASAWTTRFLRDIYKGSWGALQPI